MTPSISSSHADSWWPELNRLAPGVGLCMTTRHALLATESDQTSWASRPPFDAFNLGDHVGDEPLRVAAHRREVDELTGGQTVWLNQVHGHRVVRLSRGPEGVCVDGQTVSPRVGGSPKADGAWTSEPGLVCAVMVADCLPVILVAPQGRGVAALHAGWRGLCGDGPEMQGRGILEAGVEALCAGVSCDPGDLMAWMGPCIGPDAFEVGAAVRKGFGVPECAEHPAFRPKPSAEGEPKWWADLPGLGRERLQGAGVRHIHGGRWCTVSEPSRFFSFRRDGVTGRQAACVWLHQGRR